MPSVCKLCFLILLFVVCCNMCSKKQRCVPDKEFSVKPLQIWPAVGVAQYFFTSLTRGGDQEINARELHVDVVAPPREQTRLGCVPAHGQK